MPGTPPPPRPACACISDGPSIVNLSHALHSRWAVGRAAQEEFKGWIALNDQLDQEISEHKRVDMENRMIIKRTSFSTPY
jgi:hypothetical protein